jgi:hypothetical protein
MDFKEKKVSYYGQCRKQLTKVGVTKLEELGYITTESGKEISPKNYWNSFEGEPSILVRPEEFEKRTYFILTTPDWTHISDKAGNAIKHVETTLPSEIVFYTLKKIENYKDVYNESIRVSGSWEVPLSDLIKLEPKSVIKEKIVEKPVATLFDEDLLSDDTDEHFSSMTIRDFHCIINGVPFTDKEWLNKLIQKTNVIRNKEN